MKLVQLLIINGLCMATNDFRVGKLYLLPIWIILLSVIASEVSPIKALQYLVMWILVRLILLWNHLTFIY